LSPEWGAVFKQWYPGHGGRGAGRSGLISGTSVLSKDVAIGCAVIGILIFAPRLWLTCLYA
jgi:hypothetical protein